MQLNVVKFHHLHLGTHVAFILDLSSSTGGLYLLPVVKQISDQKRANEVFYAYVQGSPEEDFHSTDTGIIRIGLFKNSPLAFELLCAGLVTLSKDINKLE